MTTLLTDNGATEIQATDAGDQLWLSSESAEIATGWSLKPEGLCKGSVCVAIPAGRESEFIAGDKVDLAAFWRHMGRPVLHDEDGETWVLGESAVDRFVQLQSLEAPDFTLPDLHGEMHSLSDYRGKKVYLCTWASW